MSNNLPIALIIIEFMATRIRFLYRTIIFVAVYYLIFILINYIITKVVREKIIYTPINYKTWDTLGFFVLYMVLIIAFFYVGALLSDIKCITI